MVIKHHQRERLEMKVTVLVRVYIVVKGSLGRERFSAACNSQVISNHWRKSRQKPMQGRNLEAGTVVKPWGIAACLLTPRGLLSLFFVCLYSLGPPAQGWHCPQCWTLSHQLLMKKIYYRFVCRPTLWGHFLHWYFLFPDTYRFVSKTSQHSQLFVNLICEYTSY